MSRPEPKQGQGSEGFYLDKNGQKADASIHYPILDGIDPADDYQFRLESFHHAIACGVDPERAAKSYGIEGAMDLGPGSLGPTG